MSDDLFIFSNIIPAAEAKKLMAAIQKPTKNGSWQDWSGEGGFARNVNLGDVSGSAIGKILLPDYIRSIRVEISEERSYKNCGIPGTLFLGGDEWVLPDYDCDSSARFEFVESKIAYPMLCSFSKLTNMRFYRDYNVCNCFFIQESFENPEFPKKPSPEAVERIVNEWRERFQIPSSGCDGFLGDLVMGNGGICYDLDPTTSGWRSDDFWKMVEKLVSEASSDIFKISVNVTIGGTMKFYGESRNVREDAQELLRRISERNDYSSYDVTYEMVGPQDWKDRETSRKKWKKPIHQELGTLTLEDGTCATVKLRIEKEGYVFTLDFDDVDGLAAFRETKYFQKTHWNLGAE